MSCQHHHHHRYNRFAVLFRIDTHHQDRKPGRLAGYMPSIISIIVIVVTISFL
jgi:hypothetical protein